MGGHEQRDHRRFSPSQADRFFLCPGSVALCQTVPARPPSVHALRGTKAAELLEAAVNNNDRDATHAWIHHSPFKTEPVDVDLCDGVQDCLDYAYDLLDLYDVDGNAVLWAESTISVPTINAPGEADGHCDLLLWLPYYRTLYVIDYKNGVVIVEVKENRQLQQYGAGALFGGKIPVDQVDKVVLAIVQPNAFHPKGPIREWDRTPAELYDYLIDLDLQIEACEAPNAPLVPGEKQCQYCDAAVKPCPALERKALAVAHHNFKSIRDVSEESLPVPDDLPIDRLVYIKQAAPLLKRWLDEVDDALLEYARIGVPIPGYKLVEAQAKRAWYGDQRELARQMMKLLGSDDYYVNEAVLIIEQALAGDHDGVVERVRQLIEGETEFDKFMPRKLLTITDAEAYLKREYKKRVKTKKAKTKAAQDATQAMAFFTLKDTTGVTSLVTLDDGRPAVSPVAAFNQVKPV